MSPPDIDTTFGVLRSADPDVMDRDELAELTSRQLATHQAWCDALKVRSHTPPTPTRQRGPRRTSHTIC